MIYTINWNANSGPTSPDPSKILNAFIGGFRYSCQCQVYFCFFAILRTNATQRVLETWGSREVQLEIAKDQAGNNFRFSRGFWI